MIIFFTWSVIIKNAKLIWRIEKWYISVVEDSPVGKKFKIATGKCYPCSVKFHKEVAIDSTHGYGILRSCPVDKTTVEGLECRDT